MTNSQGLVAPKTLLYSSDRIQQVVSGIALQISNNLEKDLVVLCVLKGAIFFASDLIKGLDKNNIELDFIQCSSYIGTETNKHPKIVYEPIIPLENKNVLIVEDICDTGRSLQVIQTYISEQNPKTINTCVLLYKPSRKEIGVKIEWIGFFIPNKFVVGYGMDYNEKFRNLPEIYTITE